MKYEHQINWANACDTNLDDCTSRSVRNARIVLLSTLTLHSPKRMANLEVCTLYNRKNRIILYDFLQIIRVHSLMLPVSFKPIFVDFTHVIDMLVLLQFWCSHRCVCVSMCVCVCVSYFLFRPYNRGMIEFNFPHFSTLFYRFPHGANFSTWKNVKKHGNMWKLINKIKWRNGAAGNNFSNSFKQILPGLDARDWMVAVVVFLELRFPGTAL